MEEFENFLENEVLPKICGTLGTKSNDYSEGDDKLYNFRLQGRIDGCTEFEALRGNWRKHLGSIIQGLDNIKAGYLRPYDWWMEKCIDSINYQILLLAMVKDFHDKVKQKKMELDAPC